MRRAKPPVGWQSITLQLPQSTTVCAWLKTVVICQFAGEMEPNTSKISQKKRRNA